MGKTKEACSVRSRESQFQIHQLTPVSSQRFAKLKKEAVDPPAATASASTAAPTPRKRKPKPKNAASADDDDDKDDHTPITKRSKVKREAQDDDEEYPILIEDPLAHLSRSLLWFTYARAPNWS
ncbi:hypothetical protein D6D27_10585 [Aureobasidium pullulans]|nr:hypothetical protein D6D27_10585 [Aureobasidium pullulans]